jgi:hypothetical protein
MGFFNRLKTVFAASQQNWGGAMYHYFRPYVNKYFEYNPLVGAESEAILLQAAMMKIIFHQKFGDPGADAWEKYVEAMCHDLRAKKEFQHHLDGRFLIQRLTFYERRWIDLLTQQELLLFDVAYLLYYHPLGDMPTKYPEENSKLGFNPVTLHYTMSGMYTAICNDIDQSIRENK